MIISDEDDVLHVPFIGSQISVTNGVGSEF
jgi:hypothetical protein